jgi:excisionase family DNA binding protein
LSEQPIAYRIPDAVRISGIGRTTLYKLIADNKLRSTRVLGRRLVRRDDLEKLIAEGAQ